MMQMYHVKIENENWSTYFCILGLFDLMLGGDLNMVGGGVTRDPPLSRTDIFIGLLNKLFLASAH